MSGYGTKKYGADLAQALSFPEVFAAAVRESGKNPYGILENVLHLGSEAPPAGNDLQAAWHQQKLADANRLALAKVAATKRAVDELWAKHKAPVVKPVLAQRKIANPSNGNQVDIYAARKEMNGGIAYTGPPHQQPTLPTFGMAYGASVPEVSFGLLGLGEHSESDSECPPDYA